ncbi:hypothetical protein MFIFM68171_09737 [Madurella fahalii]|uniref:C2H2-type domain-containing protein n=1 Tax=Madurella fahalii TaxID=1157608 RepID=A0ABQ0GP69_9PEZI
MHDIRTSPPGTALTFSHSRESSLDVGSPVHDADTLAILMNKTSLHPVPTGQRRRNVASLHISRLPRRRKVGSEDLSAWQKDLLRPRDFGIPLIFEPVAEDDDEDLRAYRREDRHSGLDSSEIETTVHSPSAQIIADGSPNVLAESLQPTESDPDAEDIPNEAPVSIMAKCILEQHFGLPLGRSEPPKDIVEAVRICLDDISLSVRSIQGMGSMAHMKTAAGDSQMPGPYGSPFSGSESRSSSNGRKRPLGNHKEDGDDLHSRRDGSEDMGDPITQRDSNNPKRTKMESYPCPFRKRNPYRFNCREWEYCAKAPFKSISELKRHILKYHQHQEFAYKCPRCHVGFVTLEGWNAHITVEPVDMCSTRPGPLPDLANETVPFFVSNRLRNRKDHFDWVSLWQTLFPHDENVPEPDFEPVVELHEAEKTIRFNKQHTPLLPGQHKREIKPTSHPPQRGSK